MEKPKQLNKHIETSSKELSVKLSCVYISCKNTNRKSIDLSMVNQ